MRSVVLKLTMSAVGLTSGAVRHAGPVARSAKHTDLPLSGLRQHYGHRCSTHLLQVRRGLAWEAQTQSATRDTAAHAGGGQWGNVDQPQASDYKVASMPFDSMASNAVSLIGFTGRDLELKRLQSGNTVGNLTLAVSHKAGETSWCVLACHETISVLPAHGLKSHQSTPVNRLLSGMTSTSGGLWLSALQSKSPKAPGSASKASLALSHGPTGRVSSKPNSR